MPVAVLTGPASAPYLVEAADAVARLVRGAARDDDGDMTAAALRLA